MDLQEAFDPGFECVKVYVDDALARFEARIVLVEQREPVVDTVSTQQLVQNTVASAMAAFPRAQDGRSVTTDDVAPLIRAEVDRAVSALPKPQDGHTPTTVELAAPIAEAVQRTVAALPVPKNGEPGPAGPMGPVGPAGAPGSEGLPGRDGTNGNDGVPGPEGQAGAKGDLGPQGPEGPAGQNGIDGTNGNDGQRGLEGPPGKLPIIRAWSDKVHYEGDVVTHGGSLFQASRDTGRAPPDGDWTCVVLAGTDGRSFAIRGTYSETENYTERDVVMLNGASFAARCDNPGPCPGDGWQLFASPGGRGKPGERGPMGPVGPQGREGPAVTDVSLSGDGMFTVRNADGSAATCDFYPVLSKLA